MIDFGKICTAGLLIGALTIGVLAAQTPAVNELRHQLEEERSDTGRINVLHDLILELNRSGLFEESREKISEVLKLSDEIGYRRGGLNGRKLQADLYLNQGDFSTALRIAEEGLGESAGDPGMVLEFLGLMATSYRMGGEPGPAVHYYRQAIALADSLEERRSVAVNRFNMSSAQKLLGDQSGALENLYLSLRYSEQERDSLFMSVILNNIGQSFHETGEYRESLYYLGRSEAMSRRLGFRTNLLRALVNLGVSYANLDEFETGSEYYLQALELAEDLGNHASILRIHYNLGRLEMSRGNPDLAREYFTRSLEASEVRSMREGVIYSSLGLGELAGLEERYEEAIAWIVQARDLAREMELMQLVGMSLEGLYETYKAAGQLGESLQAIEHLREHEESMRSDERERLRTEYETRLELYQQEEENILLRAQQQQQEIYLRYQKILIYSGLSAFLLLGIVSGFLYRNVRLRKRMNRLLRARHREIAEKNKELDKMIHVKDKMFAIIAHDLRGPLSSLQSMIFLLKEYELSKEELHEIVESLEKRLNDNASTMDNLLAWAKSQMRGLHLNYRTFDLHSAIETVCHQIKAVSDQKGVAIECMTVPGLELEADYEAIKLVIRNLLTNAIKFCEAGDHIVLSAELREGAVHVSVSDTGVGISAENREKLFRKEPFSMKGTSNETGSGLGLKLCQEFIQKHGGEIRFESAEGEGSTFHFTLPVTGKEPGPVLENQEEAG